MLNDMPSLGDFLHHRLKNFILCFSFISLPEVAIQTFWQLANIFGSINSPRGFSHRAWGEHSPKIKYHKRPPPPNEIAQNVLYWNETTVYEAFIQWLTRIESSTIQNYQTWSLNFQIWFLITSCLTHNKHFNKFTRTFRLAIQQYVQSPRTKITSHPFWVGSWNTVDSNGDLVNTHTSGPTTMFPTVNGETSPEPWADTRSLIIMPAWDQWHFNLEMGGM